jgi:hypothetical protein
MITIGGLDNANPTDYCDWEYMSVAIYDLTDGTTNGWGSVFSSHKQPYQVNAQISLAIGGGLDGNATKLLPEGGWSTTLVANLFTGTNNQTAPVNINGATSNSGSGNQTTPLNVGGPPAPTSKSSHKAAIIGGTIGGVVFLVLAIGLALFFWRKPNFFKKPQGDVRDQFMSEKDKVPKVEADSQPVPGTRNRRELPGEFYPEAGGTPMSELSGNKALAELGRHSQVHELS